MDISVIIPTHNRQPLLAQGVLVKHALYRLGRGVPGSILRWLVAWLPYAGNRQARVRSAMWLARCLGEIRAGFRLARVR